MKTKFVRKTYVQPQTVAVEFKTIGMLCSSPGNEQNDPIITPGDD